MSVYQSPHSNPDPFLELGDFREIKVSHFHRRHNHVERFLAARSHRLAHCFDVRQHMNQAFIKSKISYPALHLAIFDIKSAVASHSSQHFLERFHLANVPKACDQDSTLGGRNHLLDALGMAYRCEDDV